MFSGEHALKKSDEFIKKNKESQTQFSIDSEQQQVVFNARHQYITSLARSRQEQARQAELTGAYAQLNAGVHGLSLNVANISRLNALPELTTATTVKPSPEIFSKKGRKAVASYSAAAKNHTEASSEQTLDGLLEEIVLEENKNFELMAKSISELKRRKDLITMGDVSIDAYQKEINRASMFMLDDRDVLLHQSHNLYEVWKKNKEDEYEKRLRGAEQQILRAEKDYQDEKSESKAAIIDYSVYLVRKDREALLGNLYTDSLSMVAQRMTCPSLTEFNVAMNKKLALTHSKNVIHPQANNLTLLIRDGKSGTDTSWRDMKNFYHNPLPRSCFDFNILTDVSDAAEHLEESSRSSVLPRLLIRTGKVIFGQTVENPVARIAGNVTFDAAELSLVEYDGARKAEIEERLDLGLDIAREVIPRVAGMDEAALKGMYEVLNKTLLTIYDESSTSVSIKRMIDTRIGKNQEQMLYQLELIRTYSLQKKSIDNDGNTNNKIR